MMKLKTMLNPGWVVALGLAVSAFTGSAQAADPRAGAKFYNMHCASCHGTRGKPRMPGVPDFSRGEALFRADSDLIRSIESGQGVMPAFRGLLSTYEMLDVIAYLRTLR